MNKEFRYCPFCGVELKVKDAEFCHDCGADLRLKVEIIPAPYINPYTPIYPIYPPISIPGSATPNPNIQPGIWMGNNFTGLNSSYYC